MNTGIIVALPEELNTLTSKKIAPGRCSFIAQNIIVAHAGTGPENASKAAEMLLAKGSSKLISWGCAAALDGSLNAGDLCLPKTLIAENQQRFPTHPEWQHQISSLLSHLQPICSEPLLESNSIVSTSAVKKALNLCSGATTLDMESVAIAKIADENNIPFLVIRAIVDPASMDLPEAINYALNHSGQIDMKRLIRHLATHPYEIPSLIKLGMHFQSARRKLKFVAQALENITTFTVNPEFQLKA